MASLATESYRLATFKSNDRDKFNQRIGLCESGGSGNVVQLEIEAGASDEGMQHAIAGSVMWRISVPILHG